MNDTSPKQKIVYDPRKHGSLPEFLTALEKVHGPIVKVTARDATPEELMECDKRREADEAPDWSPAMRPHWKELLETLGLALEGKAPKTYRELSDSGELQSFLEGRAEVITEAADFAATNATIPPQADGLEAVRALHMARKTAWEVALQEGIMDLPEDEDAKEPEEDMHLAPLWRSFAP